MWAPSPQNPCRVRVRVAHLMGERVGSAGLKAVELPLRWRGGPGHLGAQASTGPRREVAAGRERGTSASEAPPEAVRTRRGPEPGTAQRLEQEGVGSALRGPTALTAADKPRGRTWTAGLLSDTRPRCSEPLRRGDGDGSDQEQTMVDGRRRSEGQ